MEVFLGSLVDPSVWVSLVILLLLEVILGIDNLIFIAILANKLPPQQRNRARVIGLSLALVMRIGLLSIMTWLITLTEPVLFDRFSYRDIIMILGGFFLIQKATRELHERIEGEIDLSTKSRSYAKFWPIVVQIIVLDAVFSFDAVITATSIANYLWVMILAVTLSMGYDDFCGKSIDDICPSTPNDCCPLFKLPLDDWFNACG